MTSDKPTAAPGDEGASVQSGTAHSPPTSEELAAAAKALARSHAPLRDAYRGLGGWSAVKQSLTIYDTTDSSTMAASLCQIADAIGSVGRMDVFDLIAAREDLLPVTRDIARALRRGAHPAEVAPLIERWNDTPMAGQVWFEVFAGLPRLLAGMLEVDANHRRAWDAAGDAVEQLESLTPMGSESDPAPVVGDGLVAAAGAQASADGKPRTSTGAGLGELASLAGGNPTSEPVVDLSSGAATTADKGASRAVESARVEMDREAAGKLRTAHTDHQEATEELAGARTPPRERLGAVAAAPDFSWLIVNGTRFEFSRPQQRAIIKALFTAWRASGGRDGSGLTVATLAEQADAGVGFRIPKVFARHPALRTILRPSARGQWALYLHDFPGPGTNPPPK